MTVKPLQHSSLEPDSAKNLCQVIGMATETIGKEVSFDIHIMQIG